MSIGKSKGSLSGPLFASFYHVCFTRCTIYATVALSSSLTEIFTSPLHTIEERIKVLENNMEKCMTFTKPKENPNEDQVTYLSLNKIN